MCAWRGVEDRERARGCLIKARRASDLPSKIFSPGKFYVPDRHTLEGGTKVHRHLRAELFNRLRVSTL